MQRVPPVSDPASSRPRSDRARIGITLHLADTVEPGGAHLENLVLHDLLAWRNARLNRVERGD